MNIAVIGAGRVGSTLGGRWAAGDHAVTFGVRTPGDTRHDSLRAVPGVSVATPADAVAGADVVVLALPWPAVEEVARDLGPALGEAVLVDASNPIADGGLATVGGPSGAERVAAWSGSARVVKAFNTTGSGNMADATYSTGTPMLAVAGDDDGAKAVVAGLAAELGFDPVDAGPLSAADDLEHVAALWIRLAYALGNGPDIAFSLLRR
jgi:predicted dinucleotide-binding enzyme